VNHHDKFFLDFYKQLNTPYLLDKSVYTFSYADSLHKAHNNSHIDHGFDYSGAKEWLYSNGLLKITHANPGAAATVTVAYHLLEAIKFQDGYLIKAE